MQKPFLIGNSIVDLAEVEQAVSVKNSNTPIVMLRFKSGETSHCTVEDSQLTLTKIAAALGVKDNIGGQL
jgi:hypothetical protein